MIVAKTPLVLVSALALALAIPFGASARGNAPVAASVGGNVQRGRRLAVEVGCSQCHGTVGQGGLLSGPALLPNLMPWEGCLGQLREPARAMPRYSPTILNDADSAAIYSFYASLPKPRPAASIPELRQ